MVKIAANQPFERLPARSELRIARLGKRLSVMPMG